MQHDPVDRWYTLLMLTDAVEVWLIGWTPGQGTAPHDHGGAAGAFTVTAGTLTEEVFDGGGRIAVRRPFAAGATRSFGANHVHRVRSEGPVDAISIHAYSPPNRPMRHYAATARGWSPRLAGAPEAAVR